MLPRDDWPLAAAGSAAGISIALLILQLLITGVGGGGDPALLDRDAQRTGRPELPRALPDGPGPGVIGARERGIAGRLAPLRVVARPMRGPIDITARDLVWDDPAGARFATAATVTARLDADAAARGDILLDNVVLRRPMVHARQYAPLADWNFHAVFAELLEDEPDPQAPVRTIHLRDVRVADGTVLVNRPEQQFTLRDVAARMPLIVLSQPGVPEPYLRLADLVIQFDQMLPEPWQLAVRAYDGLFHFPDGRMRFNVAAATMDSTRLAGLAGVWNPADPGFGITGGGLALKVRLEDVGFLLPEWFPAAGAAAFAFSLRPLPLDRTEVTLTDLDAISDGSRLAGALTAQFGEEFFLLRSADLTLDPLRLAAVAGLTGPLPWDGALRGRVTGTDGDIAFDIDAALTVPQLAAPFTTGFTARVLLRPDEILLQRADLRFDRLPLAAVRAALPALPLAGSVTGHISLTGPPAPAPLALDARIEVGGGVALLDGLLDLTGAVPAYDLRGRLLAIDLPAFHAPELRPVSLTANFALAGTGLDPAVMDARLRVDGRFAGWETGAADTVHMAAAVRGGVLEVDALHARLATAELTANGSWRFLEPQVGAIGYTLNIASLRPFSPLLPPAAGEPVAGGIVASGTLSGSLDRLRLAGQLTGDNVRLGLWQAARLDAGYGIAAGGELLPAIVVDATGHGLGTPTAGAFATATLTVELATPSFVLDLEAVRTDGGLVEVAATGTVPEVGQRLITLERVALDLDRARWVLAHPARIRWTGDEWHVDGFLLEDRESAGRLALDGQVLPLADADIRFAIAALPLPDIQRLVALPPRVAGTLWAAGTVAGGEAPRVEIEFRLDDGAIEAVAVRELSGSIAHAGRITELRARVAADTLGYLDTHVRLPSVVHVGDSPGFELIDGEPIEGRLTARHFPLSALAAMVPAGIRNVTGAVNGDVLLSGTAETPAVAGNATLAGGAMTVMALNQHWTDMSADLGFDGRRLLIREMRARSDGWLAVGGQVVLERLDNPVSELTITLDGFRPVGVDGQRDAAIYGQLAVQGPPLGLAVTGSVHVDDGYLVIPEFGGRGPDAVQVTGAPAPAGGQPAEAAGDGGVFRNLAITNVTVTIGDGAWFIAGPARVQVSGELVVNKVGTALPITGTLSGTRGQYTLLAGPLVRRFDVVSAQIRFRGEPEPDPVIDITVRRIVFDQGDRKLDVLVRVSGTLADPRLSLAGGGAVGIAEDELLSLLIFGQPTFALGGQVLPGNGLLEQAFAGGFAELVAIELERGLGGLGFDIFQIRPGRGPLGGLGAPTLVMGRQLREDVFITVETGLAALFGGAPELPDQWGVRLERIFDPRSRATLAWEPVHAGHAFRGAVFALPLMQQRQQFLIELRRRWYY